MARHGVTAIASGLLLSACSVIGVRTVEEPPYQVVRTLGAVEIRSYGPRLAAQVVVGGTELGARSAGFQQLARYIFGANRSRASIAMTAPVAQSASEAVPMTAPVDQAPAGDGRWAVRFFMPAHSTRETLPVPNDPGVEIVTVPGETVAVLRWSGWPSASGGQAAGDRLLRALDGSAYRAAGPVMSWFYDPPWTIPPLRRNEAAVRVEGG